MRQFCLLLLLILLLITGNLFRCANSVAGGGSESGNPVVIGKIYDENGNPASNTQVLLIPHDYNPVIDEQIPDSLTDTTDVLGDYTFKTIDTGIYNIQAVHFYHGTKSLLKGVVVKKDTTVIPIATLKNTGALQVILMDTVDTINGYIYIMGTNVYQKLTNADIYSDSTIGIILGSIPPGPQPEVRYDKTNAINASQLISDTVNVRSNDTVTIGITDTTLKPIWRFSVIVAVENQTATYYGGINAVKILLGQALNKVEKIFNDHRGFHGIFSINIDSIYQFSGSANTIVQSIPAGYHCRIIYDGFKDEGFGAYIRDTRTVYHPYNINAYGRIESDSSANNLTFKFALSRGCITFMWLNVKSNNNPVNNTAFRAIDSRLHNFYVDTTWDEYSVNLINYNKSKMITETDSIRHNAFPNHFGIKVLSVANVPVSGAIVTVYSVEKNTQTVDAVSILSGTTDNSGILLFSKNPFLLSDTRYNILVSSATNSDTVYTWCPVYDVSNAWFENPDTTFLKEVRF